MITRRPPAFLIAMGLALTACAPGTSSNDMARLPPDPGAAAVPMPPMRLFGPVRAEPPRRPNADMADDFLDLSFRLETGRELDGFSRFEGPVTIGMAGAVPPTAARDLGLVMGRLRSEARLDVQAAPAGAEASVTIEFVPRAAMRRHAPEAACFAAPRVSSWRDYLRAGGARLDWTDFQTRDQVAIFIPDDVAPQEVRDCLNEELAQSLGPLNDLYRLPDSVFNDDNVNTVLTGFDMLMLRVTYDPALTPGMSREAVAARLPAILAHLNPGGERPRQAFAQTPRAYKDATERALGTRGGSREARMAAAEEALALSAAWEDHRTGDAWMMIGRIAGQKDPQTSFGAFRNASLIFHHRGLPLYSAQADLQLAGFALAFGDNQGAILAADRSLPAATAAQNAALMSGLMMVKATALGRSGQADAARRVRLDSLGWARYGMDSDADVRRRLTSIELLAATTDLPETKTP